MLDNNQQTVTTEIYAEKYVKSMHRGSNLKWKITLLITPSENIFRLEYNKSKIWYLKMFSNLEEAYDFIIAEELYGFSRLRSSA